MYKDRHLRVERECEWCGTKFLARQSSVNAGHGRFCSLAHANEWQKEEGKKKNGYENGKAYWGGKYWIVRWYGEDGNQHTTPYPHWWWDLNVEEVPDGYGVSYKDDNPENIDPSNFYLIELSEISKRNGHKSLGKARPDEAGEKNKWWRGGSSYDGYPNEFSKPLKTRIKLRDNYTCQCCYSSFDSGKLDVHHIDKNRKNNADDNLVTVCKSCHLGIHGKSSKFNDRIGYFQSLLP